MNDLAIFGSAPLPTYSAAVLEHAKNFVTSGPMMPRISTKGSRFSFVRGAEIFVAPTLTIDVVVLAARKTTSRIWYAKEYDPNSTEKIKPACWSPDDRHPVGPAETRPHVQGAAGPRPVTSCAECPMNVKGSSRNGQGKACTYKQTLVVAPPTNVEEVWRLDVSGMGAFGDSQPDQGLFSWKDYVNMLAQPRAGIPNGVAPNMLVTRLSFDARQSVPTLRFSVSVQAGQSPWLDPAMVDKAVARAQQTDVTKTLETIEDEEGAVVPVVPVAAPAAAPQQPAAPQSPQAPTGFAAAPAAQAAAAPASGFAGAAAAPVSGFAATPVTASVAPPPPVAHAAPAAPAAQPLRLAHPDVPNEVREWAAHPAVTPEMVDAHLAAEYPEALEVPVAPAAPAAPQAPAAPAAPKRTRRTKAEMDAARQAEATGASAAPAPATQQPSGFATAPAAPMQQAAAPAAPSGFQQAAAPVAAPAAPAAGLGNALASKLGSLLGGFDDAPLPA